MTHSYFNQSKVLRIVKGARDVQMSVRIEPLKARHDVINLDSVIYLMMFQFHFYLSLFHVLYFLSILVYIFCIVPKWKPSVSWFKNVESRLNHHFSRLFGVSSLAWTGHLVHVAIPGSRGEYVRWNNFLDVLPHPQGLSPLFTSQWNLYAQNPDSSRDDLGALKVAQKI